MGVCRVRHTTQVMSHICLTPLTNCSHDWVDHGSANWHKGLECVVSHFRLHHVSHPSHISHELQSRLSESWGCRRASTQLYRFSRTTESCLISVSQFSRTAVTAERIMGVLTVWSTQMCVVSHVWPSHDSHLSHTSHELQSRLSGSWECWRA